MSMVNANVRRRRTCTWSVGAIAVGLIAGAEAQQPESQARGQRATDFALALNSGLTYSDNVTRFAASGESIEDTIGLAGFTLELDHAGRRVRSNAAADLSWLHYFDDSFDDEVIGFFAGDLGVDLVPERMEWIVEENFSQLRSNPLAADTPNNREYANYFSTGPDLTLRLGAANFARLSGRYSDNTYENLNFDSQRYGGTLALGRELSGATELSLNLTSEDVQYDTAEYTDFERRAAYLQFAGEGRRMGMSLQLGYMEVEDDLGSSSGVLASLELSRRLSASSTLSLNAGTRISDAGDIFREAVDQRARFAERPAGSEVVVPTDDTFEDQSINVTYRFARNRTTLVLGGSWADEQYNRDSTLDRTMITWNGSINREISRVLVLGLGFSLSTQDFDNLGYDDEELLASASASWRLGRRGALSFAYDYYRRDSSVVFSGTEENRIGVMFSYSLSAVE